MARSGFFAVGTKLALATTLVLVVVAAAAYLGLTTRERDNLLAAKSMASSMVMSLFAESTAPALLFEDMAMVQASLNHLGKNEDVLYAAVYTTLSFADPPARPLPSFAAMVTPKKLRRPLDPANLSSVTTSWKLPLRCAIVTAMKSGWPERFSHSHGKMIC